MSSATHNHFLCKSLLYKKYRTSLATGIASVNIAACAVKFILSLRITAIYCNIVTPQGVKRVYCEMNTTNCGNITGGWMRAAYINMTNENNSCPRGLTYTVASTIRMCTRSHSGTGCASVTFPTHGVPYTKVCGRAHGYQRQNPEAFYIQSQTIEGYYVDGLSVTNGIP